MPEIETETGRDEGGKSQQQHDTDMAADSDPESEVFEITDFTTASEWERFVSRVEEVLNEWKLIGLSAGSVNPEKGEYTSGTWGEKCLDINFADFKFYITHYFLKQECEKDNGKDKLEEDSFPLAMQDLLCMNNDFPPRAHCLVRWYGIREFVVITPGTNCEAIISESKCNLLHSSVSIALANSGCQVPIFVQIQQKWRRVYAGECQGPGCAQTLRWSTFAKVVTCPLCLRSTSLSASHFDTLLGGEVGGVEFGKLPFGACEEPIRELHLATTWPHLAEGIVVDNDVYSDLDPLQAPHWSVRVRTADNPQCLLGDFLTEFFKLCGRKESTEEVLGRGMPEEEGKENSDISSALSKLTEPAAAVPISKLSVSNIVHSARKHIRRHRHTDESPLKTDVLNSVLLYLFPDAAVEKSSESSRNRTAPTNPSGIAEQEKTPDYEFVLELRYRWENNYLVYGLAAGPPDLRCCLLHQKLQMLNCCIERKRARDEARKVLEGNRGRERKVSGGGPSDRPTAGSTREVSPGKSWDSWSDSEDEFFECLSDQGEGEAPHAEGDKEGSKVKAEGRLHPQGNMTLLNSTELLYIPVTQEPAPMTEDLLEEQSEVLAKLGTSAEGTHLRARMQSACLLSDMESFKAANPGCALDDFVRWYSPRDYVEEEVEDEKGNMVLKGMMSSRMMIPGNMWVEAWESARKPADVTQNLLPCILHAAILKLKEEESVEDIPSVKKSIQQAISQASKLLHTLSHDYKKLEDFINQLMALETAITQARSLKAKFATCEGGTAEDTEELEKFVSSLLEDPEVVVLGAGQGPAGSIIHRLFINSQRAALLSPMEDEFGLEKKPGGGSNKILLRTCVPRPAPYSKALPQRLFCVLMKEEFRLAGAFSSDTTFF
ncbi:hypothetical protein F7725_014762 [Dissostichus mawsoni]|uniref:Rab3 GTPase-activating protein catalytic subunit n=1 Tax=Dissostichus mawsoni TaxID=36200 RepID=A0A7J5YWU6_DISMA|nr:hypothetical protein F7725_014762 [Dissostichus mawsoni]